MAYNDLAVDLVCEAQRASLAAIIVNYNGYEDSYCCVNSLLDLQVVMPECIVLVDNCSSDGSGERLKQAFPSINVVLLKDNLGFGAGVNAGFAHARHHDYCLILNPDTHFIENRIRIALDEFRRDSRLGILGLNLTNPDGSPQFSARRFYSLLTIALRRTLMGKLGIFRKLHNEHMMLDAWSGEVFDADWVIGGGMILRSSALAAIGGMDDGYFLYLDDTDLCKRMWIAGWRVRAIPTVKLVHAHARASQGFATRASGHHLRSLFRFWGKFGMPLVGHGRRQ